MKKLVFSILLAWAAITQAPSYAQLAPPPAGAAKQAEPNEADLQTHGHYVNKSGQAVHSPAKSVDGNVPSGASAKCGDGTYSFSKHRSGTCSHHGGVAAWLQ